MCTYNMYTYNICMYVCMCAYVCVHASASTISRRTHSHLHTYTHLYMFTFVADRTSSWTRWRCTPIPTAAVRQQLVLDI